MSSYGKILDGRLTLQHGVVNYDGKNIINPSDEILRKLGWYPVKSDVQLPPKEGFMIVESYMLVEEQVTDEGTIPSHILIKYACRTWSRRSRSMWSWILRSGTSKSIGY